MNEVTKRTIHARARKRISKLLGHQLRGSADIHFCEDGSIVVCEDRSYHMLIHQRTEALEACSHADWRCCTYCGKHDNPANLSIGRTSTYHKKCQRAYRQIQRARKAYNTMSTLKSSVLCQL